MSTGLVIFIAINVFNTVTLLFDAYLLATGQPTITNRVRGDMLMGIPIMIVEIFMLFGLAVHLFGPPDLR